MFDCDGKAQVRHLAPVAEGLLMSLVQQGSQPRSGQLGRVMCCQTGAQLSGEY